MSDMPRIQTVRAVLPATLLVTWAGSGSSCRVNLDAWIASGDTLLAALARPDVFCRASLAGYGSLVTWDDDTGDLAIDAAHLEAMAQEQHRSADLDPPARHTVA